MRPLVRSLCPLLLLLLASSRAPLDPGNGALTAAAPPANAIQRENAKPGTSEWKLTNTAYTRQEQSKATRR